jgi:hypothetical protein
VCVCVGKDWLQVTAEDQCGLVGQAEAVLVDPSCSNSGTLTGNYFSKVLYIGAVYGKYTRTLTFENVLVDPSCSNSGTRTDTRSVVPHARMQRLTGFQTRALSHASILKSPLCNDWTWKYGNSKNFLTCENVCAGPALAARAACGLQATISQKSSI